MQEEINIEREDVLDLEVDYDNLYPELVVDDSDVYGTVGANVSFHDRDAGWSVSGGDYFVINCRDLGCDDGDHKFQILDENSNKVLFKIGLPLAD